MKRKSTRKERSRSVPFVDLRPETRAVSRRYLARVKAFLSRGNFILTKEVQAFEEAWAAYVGNRFAIGVSSGADALYLLLLALGVGEGDEVITQGNAYNASVVAILRTGATPRFADIDETLQMDAGGVEKLINQKTKAILPVHLFGQMADMGALERVAAARDIFLISDAAQAHGAACSGKSAGRWGRAAAWSFYPTKNLGAFGDAGAVTTDDASLAEKIRSLRNLGQEGKDNHTRLGFNMRLDPIQAIALTLKLQRLNRFVSERRRLAARYDALLAREGVPVRRVPRRANVSGSFHLYVVLLPEGVSRAGVREKLLDRGIGTGVHYPLPVYRQAFWKGSHDPCPRTDSMSSRVLSLPFYPGMSPAAQTYVVETLKAILP
jgi:dTDP-4-amino-4,6-dideoxygalactose transaminase